MPNEFWREVVDRVAQEAPDTLLLAEAFWLLEGYFVRTLGMHRVYNSAFMHMLRDEDNAGYRKVVRDTLEFDPEILKRYVNFMTNPDEETAIEQFGTGDKYFGIATVLATMPGLPMIGHGQIEGFGEKYGMEFRRARLDERPNEGLIARFEHEIVPLLHHRRRFAEAADFRLFDVTADGGGVLEDVYAYSNGRGPERSLIVYHNRFASVAGWIRDAVPFARKAEDGTKSQARDTLGDALGVPRDEGAFVGFRDARSGLEFLRLGREIADRGLFVELNAYRCLVLGEFRELHDSPDARWSDLAATLAGRGVPSLEEALLDLRLAPVHDAVRGLLEPVIAPDRVGGTPEPDARRARFLEVAGVAADAKLPDHLEFPDDVDPGVRAAILLDGISSADFDRLRLWVPLHAIGFGEIEIGRIRVALGLLRPSQARTARQLAEAWLSEPGVRAFLGVNEWEGHEWFGQEAFGALLALAAELDRAEGLRRASPSISRLRRAAETAGYRVDRFLAELGA
jgi:hypothetical protein